MVLAFCPSDTWSCGFSTWSRTTAAASAAASNDLSLTPALLIAIERALVIRVPLVRSLLTPGAATKPSARREMCTSPDLSAPMSTKAPNSLSDPRMRQTIKTVKRVEGRKEQGKPGRSLMLSTVPSNSSPTWAISVKIWMLLKTADFLRTWHSSCRWD